MIYWLAFLELVILGSWPPEITSGLPFVKTLKPMFKAVIFTKVFKPVCNKLYSNNTDCALV